MRKYIHWLYSLEVDIHKIKQNISIAHRLIKYWFFAAIQIIPYSWTTSAFSIVDRKLYAHFFSFLIKTYCFLAQYRSSFQSIEYASSPKYVSKTESSFISVISHEKKNEIGTRENELIRWSISLDASNNVVVECAHFTFH